MITFKTVKRPSPKDNSEGWYAAPVWQSALDADDISEEIAASTTLTASDVKATLSALQRQVIRHLLEGDSINLGDLGLFRDFATQ